MKTTTLALTSALAIHAAAHAAPPPALEFRNQSNEKPFNRSAIQTSDGYNYWDFQFDATVNASIGNNFKEIVFSFNQCFGGGMIDEMVARNWNNSAFTSAAGHWQQSYARSEDRTSGVDTNFPGLRSTESTYSLRWAPKAGGANPMTQVQAATAARRQDIAGPFSNVKGGNFQIGGLTSPQFTFTGAGDRIKLHRGANDTKYRAILFAGSSQLDVGPAKKNNAPGYVQQGLAANWNSLIRMRTELINAGYTDNEIYVMYPGGDARNVAGDPTGRIYRGGPRIPNWVDAGTRYEDLRSAWTTWMAGETDNKTQIFFWSSFGHGTAMADVKAQKDAQANPKIKKGEAFNWDMDVELGAQIASAYAYNSTITFEDSAYGLPYFLVETADLIPDLSINLNGASLSLISSELNPLGGHKYKFELPASAISQLQSSLQNLTVAWDFGTSTDPYGDEATFITMMGPTAGDFANGVNVPGPAAITTLALAAVALRRRRA